MRRLRLVTSLMLIVGLLLAPVHQAMACSAELMETAGDDVTHDVHPDRAADSSGTGQSPAPDTQDPCACFCTVAPGSERIPHNLADNRPTGDAGYRLPEAPRDRELRPPRPTSV